MAVIQDAFNIPDDIATGIATGLYSRYGSVVRYASGAKRGQIVRHLKPADPKAEEAVQGIGEKAFQFVKQNRKGAIIAVAGAAAIGSGLWVFNKVKNHEPKVVKEFRISLRKYIEAIRNGALDIDVINDLILKTEKIRLHRDYEKISVHLATEKLNVLVQRIQDYTIKLADDNEMLLTAAEIRPVRQDGADVIASLENYLQAQKRVFETTV